MEIKLLLRWFAVATITLGPFTNSTVQGGNTSDSNSQSWLTSNPGTNQARNRGLASLRLERNGERMKFFFENFQSIPVTATVEIRSSHLDADKEFPLTTTLPPGKRVYAFELQPNGEGLWDFSLKSHYMLGDRGAEHDENWIYSLPYDPGAEYPVDQGYSGAFSHTGQDQYSIDWRMPPGARICAARGGKVIELKIDSNVGGPDPQWKDHANYLLILHEDGTIGCYSHLMEQGAVVEIGDSVDQGQPIGYSGNTGFTTGPHLHFSVYRPQSGSVRESLPVKFRTSTSKAAELVAGQSYRRPNEDHLSMFQRRD